MKDRFSTDSASYALFRPSYPDSFFTYLRKIKSTSKVVWDCGTGNGQVAQKLAGMYDKIYASDISLSQLNHAVKLKNIDYSLQPAEKTNYPDNFFDLIVVAQAVHWFNFEKFYSEVRRTAKENALLVIIGYGLLKISNEIDPVIRHFYQNIIGSYWDKERKYIDEAYQTIPFPFNELKTPEFHNSYQWTLEHLIGYLKTWSAVKHYERHNGNSPIELIYNELKKSWGTTDKRPVNFPMLLRIGKIK